MLGFKKIIRIFYSFIVIIIGWFLIKPLSFFFKKKHNSILIIGGSSFSDNTKYFFIDIFQDYKDITVHYLCKSREIESILLKNNLPVLYYPSIKAFLWILRSKIIVVDSSDFLNDFLIFFMGFTKKVQLWHGVGCKRIELDLWRYNSKNNLIIYFIILGLKYLKGDLIKYSLVLSTSSFYQNNVFVNAFWSKYFLISGYPRNAFEKDNSFKMLNTDSDIIDFIKNAKNNNKKIILITPTYRTSNTVPNIVSDLLSYDIDSWCIRNKVVFIFKLHPYDDSYTFAEKSEYYKFYDKKSDVYPCLKDIDLLVGDYSSIIMDFLIIDKPIIYYIPDFNYYSSIDRSLQFDYRDFMVGYRIDNFESLLEAIILELKDDSFKNERAILKEKVFGGGDQNNSTEDLINYFFSKNWISKT